MKFLVTKNFTTKPIGPRQANLVLIAYASSEGSGEPAHPRSLARTFAARPYKQWIKRNLQTESQIPGPAEWLDMRSWNLSWRNARRHKFAWRGSINLPTCAASLSFCAMSSGFNWLVLAPSPPPAVWAGFWSPEPLYILWAWGLVAFCTASLNTGIIQALKPAK